MKILTACILILVTSELATGHLYKFESIQGHSFIESHINIVDDKVYLSTTVQGHGDDETIYPGLQGGILIQYDINGQNLDWFDYFRTDTTQIKPLLVKSGTNDEILLYSKQSFGNEFFIGGTALSVTTYNKNSEDLSNKPINHYIDEDAQRLGWLNASYFSLIEDDNGLTAFYNPTHSSITWGTYWYSFNLKGELVDNGIADSLDVRAEDDYSFFHKRKVVKDSNGEFYGYGERDVVNNDNRVVDSTSAYIFKYNSDKELIWRKPIYSENVNSYPFNNMKIIGDRILAFKGANIYEISKNGDIINEINIDLDLKDIGISVKDITAGENSDLIFVGETVEEAFGRRVYRPLIFRTDSDFEPEWYYIDKSYNVSARIDAIVKGNDNDYYYSEVFGDSIRMVRIEKSFVTSVEDNILKSIEISIHPNPTFPGESVNIDIPSANTLNGLSGNFQISIYSVAGNNVHSISSENNSFRLPTSIVPGVYVISISTSIGIIKNELLLVE
jgi:hypothetical protein